MNSIRFGEDRRISMIIKDRLSSNRSYLVDQQGNIYFIEFSSTYSIEESTKKSLPLTHIQPIFINSKPMKQILHIGILQRDNDRIALGILLQSIDENQDKVGHPQSVFFLFMLMNLFIEELITLSSSSFDHRMNESIFLNRIHSILRRNESIPSIVYSFNSSEMISNEDIQKNLMKIIPILTNEYLQRQRKTIEEIRSRENYLSDLQRTQLNQSNKIEEKFSQTKLFYEKLLQQYHQVSSPSFLSLNND